MSLRLLRPLCGIRHVNIVSARADIFNLYLVLRNLLLLFYTGIGEILACCIEPLFLEPSHHSRIFSAKRGILKRRPDPFFIASPYEAAKIHGLHLPCCNLQCLLIPVKQRIRPIHIAFRQRIFAKPHVPDLTGAFLAEMLDSLQAFSSYANR